MAHGDQNPEVQLGELRRYCQARGLSIKEEITDHGYSGATDNRPGLKRLMELARKREIDVVIVVKLDRFFRSLKHLITVLQEFMDLGILFISIKDQIDMTTAAGRLMFHIIGAFAEFEKALIVERTLAGLHHARSQGKRLGRPPIHDAFPIRKLRSKGLSYRAIANRLRVSMGTVSRALRAEQKSPTHSTRFSSANSGTEIPTKSSFINGRFQGGITKGEK